MAEPVEDRYARQSHVFPVDRRQSSTVAVLRAESNPFAGAAVLAGAAAMGLPVVSLVEDSLGSIFGEEGLVNTSGLVTHAYGYFPV